MRSAFFTLSAKQIATAILLIGCATAVSWNTPQVLAAEQILLKYQGFEVPISVQELKTLAETGEAPPTLQAYISLTNQDPQQVRRALTQEVKVNPLLLDNILNNPVGEALLDRIGRVVHTPARKADRQAIRSAITLSALPDGRVSLLEIIQKYPTADVQVEGDQLVEAYEQLSRIERLLRDVNDLFQGIL
ncbi:hypothetical protein BST81_14605 [Leptolyngbya sp. 'hensonii']|uniref:alpha/beta hydrolase n=1 Tax=Leptolyngbya sp. 'hensonii' TaxID=1922337 RepID=UPI00094F8613|nr:alpha/beta hydrolase [Leptolyngbya sp. 'hensonii']OLP17556.1 hypothetical protein BST81_14605 [Leptolyngbya sp. 'hensonii']